MSSQDTITAVGNKLGRLMTCNFIIYVLFNSISAILGRWKVDNGRLCAMEPHLQLNRTHDC